MEQEVFLKQRFVRLRSILMHRDQAIKDMELQVIDLFEQGNMTEIELLMNKKQLMTLTNHKLSQFIEKWESQSEKTDNSCYTTV